jgi:hypothetical protein
MIDGVKILEEKKFKAFSMYLREDGIMNTVFEDNILITIADVAEALNWVESLGGKRYLNLFEGGYNTDFDVFVREYASSAEENNYTIADAIITTTLSLNMVAKFYIQFNKPHMPTKVFKRRDEAIRWLLSFK